MYYTIAPEIFEKFPGYVRGIVIARDVTNGESPAALVSLLREAEDSMRAHLSVDDLTMHPRIASWRDAFRSFGARPSEFRSSIEAMARRVLRGGELPSINRLVDIGNIVSLRHVLPVGGHDIGVIEQDIALRLATGNETFVPLGSEQQEHPDPGEVIFAEGDTVLTRRWTWRQGNHTAAVLETRHIEINVDGLPPVPQSEVEGIFGEIMELVQQFCGGKCRYEVLNRDNPQIRLSEV